MTHSYTPKELELQGLLADAREKYDELKQLYQTLKGEVNSPSK